MLLWPNQNSFSLGFAFFESRSSFGFAFIILSITGLSGHIWLRGVRPLVSSERASPYHLLLTTMKILPGNVVGGVRDSCSTNGVAMRAIKNVLTNMQDLMCISQGACAPPSLPRLHATWRLSNQEQARSL
jgi:hypothetical protein